MKRIAVLLVAVPLALAISESGLSSTCYDLAAPTLVPYFQMIQTIGGTEKRIAIVPQQHLNEFNRLAGESRPIQLDLDSSRTATFGRKLEWVFKNATDTAMRFALEKSFGHGVAKQKFTVDIDDSQITSAQIREIAQRLLDQGVKDWNDVDVVLGQTLIPGSAFVELIDQATKFEFVKLNIESSFNDSVRGKVINIIYSLTRTAFWGPLAAMYIGMLMPETPQWGEIRKQMNDFATLGFMVSTSASFAGSILNSFSAEHPWAKKMTYFMPNFSANLGIKYSRAAALLKASMVAEKIKRALVINPDWRDIVIVTENSEQTSLIVEAIKMLK